jgi:hypothetical protein
MATMAITNSSSVNVKASRGGRERMGISLCK